MEVTLQAVYDQIGEYGYTAVFIAMLLTGMGVPLPGELTLGFTGYLVSNNQLELAPAIVSTVLGDIMGAVISYGLGRFAGSRLVRRYLAFLLPSGDKLAAISNWLDKYGVWAVVGGRILPVVRGAIPVPAGFVRMNTKAYVFANLISSIIWCGTLIYVGMSLGHNWQQIAELGNTYGMAAATGLAVALVAGYLIFCAKN